MSLLLIFSAIGIPTNLPHEPDSKMQQPNYDVENVSALKPADIVLPTAVPGTTLLAKEITVYDGPFLEDGTDREVVGIAALVVENYGSEEIFQTAIRLEWGSMELSFYGECIPAGATVLLLERSAKVSIQKNFTGCTGWQITSHNQSIPSEMISLEDRALGTVVVANRTDKTMKDIWIYYKSWLPAQDILVGGIVYAVNIPALEAGSTQFLYPYHYASGFSKVVSVKIGL